MGDCSKGYCIEICGEDYRYHTYDFPEGGYYCACFINNNTDVICDTGKSQIPIVVFGCLIGLCIICGCIFGGKKKKTVNITGYRP